MDEKRSLSLEHWSLTRWPFRAAPPADQLYPTASLTEALARIEYLVDGGRRLGVVLGQPGVGKSLSLKAAAREAERRGHAVVAIDATSLSSRELVWQVACGLGACPSEDADLARLWRHIGDRVTENRIQQKHTILFADDVGQAGPDVVAQFVRLARLDTTTDARWTMILSAEPEQSFRWNRALLELVDLRIELVPWSQEDTIGYVQLALVDAGRMQPLFEDDALVTLHQIAQGVARQVARLADFALLAGAAAGLSTIDGATIEAAFEEIAWPVELAAY